FIILAMNVNHFMAHVESQVEIKVYLTPDAKPEQVKAVETALRNQSGIKSVVYVSKDQGMEELKRRLGDKAELLEGLEKQNPLQDRFDVKTYDPHQTPQVAEKIRQIPHVDEVQYGKGWVEKFFDFTRMVRNVGLVFIVGLAFTAMFLISNTIKITIFARRREIEVMKLVGATNWFIRWPFFIEGMLLGFLGALLPIAVLWVGYHALLDMVRQDLSLFFLDLLPVTPLMAQVSLLLVAIGMLIGMWGSLISMRRFLKV
ncbi:MAG: permease-like cell division protein FtsX, partial [Calditerricola sp.]|nr:permease-like cell division protein FtsX [Calditerricola sp.]